LNGERIWKIRYGKYGNKIVELWKDMENMEVKQVE
jgi:hypothetical protein